MQQGSTFPSPSLSWAQFDERICSQFAVCHSCCCEGRDGWPYRWFSQCLQSSKSALICVICIQFQQTFNLLELWNSTLCLKTNVLGYSFPLDFYGSQVLKQLILQELQGDASSVNWAHWNSVCFSLSMRLLTWECLNTVHRVLVHLLWFHSNFDLGA